MYKGQREGLAGFCHGVVVSGSLQGNASLAVTFPGPVAPRAERYEE